MRRLPPAADSPICTTSVCIVFGARSSELSLLAILPAVAAMSRDAETAKFSIITNHGQLAFIAMPTGARSGRFRVACSA